MKGISSHLITAGAVAAALSLTGPAMAAESGYGAPSAQPQAGQALGSSAQMQSGHQAAGASQGSFARWAQGKQVKDVTGKELYDQSGKRLGEIEKVVRNKKTEQAAAVISVGGGLLGMGGKDVAIPLSEIAMQKGKLTAPAFPGPERIEQQHAYKASQYQAVSGDRSLSEFSAFEASPGAASKHQSWSGQSGSKSQSSPQGQSGETQSQ